MKTLERFLDLVHDFIWGTYFYVEVKVPQATVDVDGNSWTPYKKFSVKVKMPPGYTIEDDFLNAIYEDLAARSLRG